MLIKEPERIPTNTIKQKNTNNANKKTTISKKVTPTTILVSTIGFITMVTYFMVPSQLPFYAESLNIQSSTAVGFLLALVGLVWGLTSTQYARLRKMLSFEKIAMFALLSISVGYILLFLSTNITIMVIALALVGAGVGTTLPNLNTWLITTTSSEFKGRALGSFFMGQFLSPVITRPITASLGIPYGYLMGGLSLFILFVLCAVYERKKLRYDKTKQTKIKGSAV